MSTQIPSVGRIVHYFPNNVDIEAGENQAEVLPAIIVQTWNEEPEQALNLSIFTANELVPVVTRFSVPHKNQVDINADGDERKAYWDWPAIKASAPPKGSPQAQQQY